MRFVAYYRVSTEGQRASGLGLEAQEAAVRGHVARSGGVLVADYRETESGRKCDRPELARAMSHCRMARATLVIAKFDRLSRNVHFISGLMESGVDFVACDMPSANRLTIHIMAAVAEQEARAISDRTRAALAARKARGLPLGMGTHRVPGAIPIATVMRNRERALEAIAKDVQDADRDIRPVIEGLRAEGKSLRETAAALNVRGFVSRRGGPWSFKQVARVLERAGTPSEAS